MKKLILLVIFITFSSFNQLFATEEIKNAVKMTTDVLNQLEDSNLIKCEDNSLDDGSNQLQTRRELSPFMKKCFGSIPEFEEPKSFIDAIKLAVEFNMPSQDNMLSVVNVLNLYNVKTTADKSNSTGQNWESQVGLFSHPMCNSIDNYFIARKSASKHASIFKTKDKIQKFTKTYNSIFDEYQQAVKNKKSAEEIKKIFGKMKNFYIAMLASMAKRESLSDADIHLRPKSDKNQSSEFHKYFGGNGIYSRPKGVKFYNDNQQDSEISKRNIGLYQFAPTSNIDDCFTAWNNTVGKRSQSCRIDFDQTTKDKNLQKFLLAAASDQVFNAFCGANKIVQSYGVQVNSKSFKHPEFSYMQLTHKDNLLDQEKVKAPTDRCVSPFVFRGNAFMHFGVLGFTDENNTKDVIDGTLDYLE